MNEVLKMDISGKDIIRIAKSLMEKELNEELTLLMSSLTPKLHKRVIIDILKGRKELKGDSLTNLYIK